MIIGPGSRVKCIKDGPWVQLSGPDIYRGKNPAFGEICTVADVKLGVVGEGFILVSYQQNVIYSARHFRPLDGIDELAELCHKVEDPDELVVVFNRTALRRHINHG